MITVKNISSRPFIMPGDADVLERIVAPGDAKEFELTYPVYSFVSAYVNAGELVVTSGELVDPTGVTEIDTILDDLREEARSLGVSVDARWKESRLHQEIEAAKAAS